MKDLTHQTWNEVTSAPTALVDFYSTSCPPCRMIKPILEALSQEMADKVQFFAVNVDDEYQLADQYDIEAVPTLILFKDGQEVDRQEGALSKPTLKSWIESQTI